MGAVTKKLLALAIALAMVMTSGIAVFATDSPESGSEAKVTIKTSEGNYSKKSIDVQYTKTGEGDVKVEYSADKGKTWKSVDGGDSSAQITGLKDRGLYQIKVTSGSNSSKVQYRYMKNTKVTKAKSAKKKQVTLTWKKDSKATGYQIQYYDGKTWKKVTVGKKTKLTIKKLKSGKKYKFRVRPIKKVSGKKYMGVLSGTKTCKVK